MSGGGLRFCLLGSGSRGNACLVQSDDALVMIDCGLTVTAVRERMAERDLQLNDLDAILVTHEHSDHLGGVGRLARATGATVYLTPGTYQGWRDSRVPDVELIAPDQPFDLDGFSVHPVPVPHDARQPCQYVLDDGRHRFGLLTDLGHAQEAQRQHYGGLDAFALECNHDPAMLRDGPYPFELKQRVGGDLGHLSNLQAADLLSAVDRSRLQAVVAVHLSETNNAPALATAALREVVGPEVAVSAAAQDAGTGWVQLL